MSELLIEGLTRAELLALTREEFDALILTGQELTFRAGSAVVLGRFNRIDDRLVVELGHIDGGGEGVLPLLASLADAYARREGLDEIEWIVHAVNCPTPNPRLRRRLEKRGFSIHDLPDVGEVSIICVSNSPMQPDGRFAAAADRPRR